MGVLFYSSVDYSATVFFSCKRGFGIGWGGGKGYHLERAKRLDLGCGEPGGEE